MAKRFLVHEEHGLATIDHPVSSIEDSFQRARRRVSITDVQLNVVLDRILKMHTPLPNPPSGLGNPGPLGLGAFALTIFIFSVFNAGSNLIDSSLEKVILPVALFYGGVAQFAAGMWEFQINNTFGATTFTSYGAFWMSFAAYVYFIFPKIESTEKIKKATGLFLISWFIFNLYMTVAAWKVSKAVFAIFFVLNFTFLFLIIGNLANVAILTSIGGWLGIITAFLAWYASFGVIINTTFKKSLIPIGTYQHKQREAGTYQDKQREASIVSLDF